MLAHLTEKKVTSLNPGLGKVSLSMWSLHVLSMYGWICSRYSSFLPWAKNMLTRLISDSEWPVCVSVR